MRFSLTFIFGTLLCHQIAFARYAHNNVAAEVQENYEDGNGDNIVKSILSRNYKNDSDNNQYEEEDELYDEKEEDDVDSTVTVENQNVDPKTSEKNQYSEISKLVDLNLEPLSNISSNAQHLVKDVRKSIIKVLNATVVFKAESGENKELEEEELNLLKRTTDSLSNFLKDLVKLTAENTKISKSDPNKAKKLMEAQRELLNVTLKNYIDIFDETEKNIRNLVKEIKSNKDSYETNQAVIIEMLRATSSDIRSLDFANNTVRFPNKATDSETIKTTIAKRAIEMNSTRARLRRRRRRQTKKILRRFRRRRRQQRRRVQRRRQRERRRTQMRRNQKRRIRMEQRRRYNNRKERMRYRMNRTKLRRRLQRIKNAMANRRRRSRKRDAIRKERIRQRMRQKHLNDIKRLRARMNRQQRMQLRRQRLAQRRRRMQQATQRLQNPSNIRERRLTRNSRIRRRPAVLNRNVAFLSRPYNNNEYNINELDEPFVENYGDFEELEPYYDENNMTDVEENTSPLRTKDPEVVGYSRSRRMRRRWRRQRRRLLKRLRRMEKRRNKQLQNQSRRRKIVMSRRRRAEHRLRMQRRRRSDQRKRRRLRYQLRRERYRNSKARQRAARRRREHARIRRLQQRRSLLKARRAYRLRLLQARQQIRNEINRNWSQKQNPDTTSSRPFDQAVEETQIEKQPTDKREREGENKTEKIKKEKESKADHQVKKEKDNKTDRNSSKTEKKSSPEKDNSDDSEY